MQETVITVARNIGGLRYDPAAGSFKGWLLQTARWRIADQFRLRQRHDRQEEPAGEDGPRTALIDRIPDPGGFDLEAALGTRSGAATCWRRPSKRSGGRSTLGSSRFFDCYVTKGWPAARVARELGVSLAQVYVGKHRVGALRQKIVAGLNAVKVELSYRWPLG